MNPIQEMILELTKDKKRMNRSQLARELNINRSEVTYYINRGGIPKDEVCIKLAELAGRKPGEILLIAAKFRSPKAAQKTWDQIYEVFNKASNFMFGVAVALGALLLASPAEAALITVLNGYYVKFKNRLSRLFNGLRTPCPYVQLSFSHAT